MIECTPEIKNDRKVGRPLKNSHDDSLDMRHKILQTSKRIFFKLAFEKVSMRMIAKHSDVSPALVAYYFISKEGLYEAVLNDIVEGQKRALYDFKLVPKNNAFETILDAHLYLIKKDPGVQKIIFRGFLSENIYEKQMIHEFLMEPSKKFISQLIDIKCAEQGAAFVGFMPGLVFTTALWQCLDLENRDKVFPGSFEEDMKKSVESIGHSFKYPV